MKEKTKKGLSVLGAAAISAGVLASLAGCGGEQPAPSSAADSGEAKTVFNYGCTAYSGSGVGVDPHDGYCGWSTLRYGIGETLVKISDEGTMEPWLAESWKANDDSTRWTFQIKDGVTFSNGKKVDAAAVKDCFDRLVQRNERAAAGTQISKITAKDQTLTIETKAANPILVNWLADPFACVIDVSGEVDGLNHVIGTGPYLLEKADDTGVVVHANKNYWNGTPKFETINVTCFLDGDTMSMAMQRGELDACANLGYDTVPNFQNNPAFQIHSTATSRSYQFLFNTKDEFLSDSNVRRAISMAVDKEGFVNTLMNGFGSVAQLCFPESYIFGDGRVKGPAYDVEAAKKLLAQAGFADSDGDGYLEKDGKPFDLKWVTYRNRQELPLLAEAAQENLRQIGIRVTIDDNEGNAMVDDVPKDFDIYSWANITAPYADGLTFFNELLTNYDLHGWSGKAHDEFVVLYNKAVKENDPEKRADYSVQLQQMLIDNNILVTASHNVMNIVTKASVSGLEPHPSDYYEITADLTMN